MDNVPSSYTNDGTAARNISSNIKRGDLDIHVGEEAHFLSSVYTLPTVYYTTYMKQHNLVTLTLKLPIETDRLDVLYATAEQSCNSYNRVCKVGWEMQRLNGVELHKMTYTHERSITKLPSQLICAARVKATESIKSAKTRLKQGRKSVCPHSTTPIIRYDARSASINLDAGTATLASIEGRVACRLVVPTFYQQRIEWKICSSDLIFKNKRAFLYVVVEKLYKEFQPTDQVLGVDLGVNRPAVTSDAIFFGKRQWKKIEHRYFTLRRALQAKGTKSAKRHLKKIGRKVNRFRIDCDHVLSRRIVNGVKPGATIVLEDLTNIRDKVKARKKTRRRIHSWSFSRLKSFLDYKSKINGCLVEYVDPRYTSQKCSKCGNTEKANRETQSWFLCKKCRFQHNADLNAAKNIRSNYLASKGISVASGPQSIGLLQPS